ncbi:MAG: ATP-binding cassette domain-containing protein [Methylobacteriaceae bacterium]|nr:ATP-binding cassette domain-containing protein [Methylobacteriaceae bacterium]
MPPEPLRVQLRQDAPIRLDVAFECAGDQTIALVGPSGSGKSTVLRCIAGLHTPRAGLVSIAGTVWLDRAADIDLPPHRRRVGLVFQHYALFPHLTALGNVAVALGHLPTRQRQARAMQLLAQLRVDELARRKPAELSGGQQQRVAIARALAREPATLLLDEPFSAVDRPTRRLLHGELARLRQSLNIPIVLVTHDIAEAIDLADRLVVLDAGVMLQSGPAAAVRSAPVSARVAEILDL